MTYEDRYGSTKIRDTKTDNLSVNWDYDTDASNKAERFPVLFYTPHMDHTDDHYHIHLDRDNAAILRDWLDKFLKDTDTTHESSNRP